MKPTDKMARTLGALALFGASAPGEINEVGTIQSGSSGAVSAYTLATDPLTPRGSGHFSTVADCTVTCSVPGAIVTFQLKIGTQVVRQARVTSDGTHGLAFASFGFQAGPLNAPEAFSIVATPASGNVTVANIEAYIAATETGV